MLKQIYRRVAERKLGSRRALMETHYEEVQAMYQQMRTWRHD